MQVGPAIASNLRPRWPALHVILEFCSSAGGAARTICYGAESTTVAAGSRGVLLSLCEHCPTRSANDTAPAWSSRYLKHGKTWRETLQARSLSLCTCGVCPNVVCCSRTVSGCCSQRQLQLGQALTHSRACCLWCRSPRSRHRAIWSSNTLMLRTSTAHLAAAHRQRWIDHMCAPDTYAVTVSHMKCVTD